MRQTKPQHQDHQREKKSEIPVALRQSPVQNDVRRFQVPMHYAPFMGHCRSRRQSLSCIQSFFIGAANPAQRLPGQAARRCGSDPQRRMFSPKPFICLGTMLN